ncbi:MAG TPA: DUF11 domain-containing protein, partial [Myxococcota bacterium]|nr:DUF11 domain-containing protein [Myxococcota bacterium]
RLFVENLRDAPLEALSIVDELDGLNAVPAFEPGTLRIVSAPAGADASGTDASGGTAGTGRLEVGNLSLSGANDSVLVEFEVTLAGVLPDGTEVRNQSTLSTRGILFAQSDDPAVNGEADPLTPGDEDPTVVPIESAPVFQVEKTSAYVTGDPDVLLAGETLRYTITVTNIGDDDAVDTTIRDAVPVNAAYVPGSTTLNGLPVQDDPGGVLPLSDGLSISAPEEPTPGLLRAGDPAEGGGVATLIFDVVVDADVVDGTVVSNQAFVSAPRGGVGEQPSDDPRTPLPDDPTRDVVGNAPLLFAPKSVTIETDLGIPGVVDPGDVLRYRITVYNSGAADATAVRLRDDVPPETTYVADSLTLDGLPVGQPDGGVSPLVQGIAISSSELVPPLPPSGGGRIRAGENAVVTFALRVNDGVPGGTIIRNQALVESAELPGLRTDGDGD